MLISTNATAKIGVYRALGGEAPLGFPRGEAVAQIGYSEPIWVTEEECGQKCKAFLVTLGFLQVCNSRHSSSDLAIARPPCALRSALSAALTVHRTVIHSRRLRFAYPGGRWPEGPDEGRLRGLLPPSSVKNQRFLTASPWGEAFGRIDKL